MAESAFIKLEYPLKILIKTMLNRRLPAMAGLQFLVGVKECR